jgi:hypothetical protein
MYIFVYVSFYNLINVQIYTCLSFSIQEFSLPEPMNWIIIFFCLLFIIFLLKSVHLLVQKHRIPVPYPDLVNIGKNDIIYNH